MDVDGFHYRLPAVLTKYGPLRENSKRKEKEYAGQQQPATSELQRK